MQLNPLERYYVNFSDSFNWRIIYRDDLAKEVVAQEERQEYKNCFERSEGRTVIRQDVGESALFPPVTNDFNGIAFLGNCHYCRGQLLSSYEETDRGRPNYMRYLWKLLCPFCGWWVIRDFDELPAGTVKMSRDTLTEGIVKRFNIDSSSIPVEVLRGHLEKNPSDMMLLNSTVFEKLVGDVYRDFYSCEVRHVGGPGDNGVDLYAVISDEPVLIQAKRRSSPAAVERVKIVRELIGTLITEGAHKGHIVTTAGDFTGPAKNLVKNEHLARLGIEIELRTLGDLWAMLHLSTNREEDPFKWYV